VLLLFYSFAAIAVAAFVVIYGFVHQAGSGLPPPAIPKPCALSALVRSMAIAVATTSGGFSGSVVGGRVFDVTGGYSAWLLIIALLAAGALARMVCTSFLTESCLRREGHKLDMNERK
jgi:hypothetical protein